MPPVPGTPEILMRPWVRRPRSTSGGLVALAKRVPWSAPKINGLHTAVAELLRRARAGCKPAIRQ